MPENDQTKWRGIRPTNPPENIPTTTIKLPPAIADLAAISDSINDAKSATGNATISYTMMMTAVPPGELWIVKALAAINNTSMCDITAKYLAPAGSCFVASEPSIPSGLYLLKTLDLVMEPTACIVVYFKLGGAADVMAATITGHKVALY